MLLKSVHPSRALSALREHFIRTTQDEGEAILSCLCASAGLSKYYAFPQGAGDTAAFFSWRFLFLFWTGDLLGLRLEGTVEKTTALMVSHSSQECAPLFPQERKESESVYLIRGMDWRLIRNNVPNMLPNKGAFTYAMFSQQPKCFFLHDVISSLLWFSKRCESTLKVFKSVWCDPLLHRWEHRNCTQVQTKTERGISCLLPVEHGSNATTRRLNREPN